MTTTRHHKMYFSVLILFLLGCEQEAKIYDANPTIHDVSLGKIEVENVARDFRLPGSVIVDERIQKEFSEHASRKRNNAYAILTETGRPSAFGRG